MKSKDNTHTYAVTGMTCAGCVKTVTEKLKTLKGITAVKVTLEPPQVMVSGEEVTPDVLNSYLKGTKFKVFDVAPKARLIDKIAFYRPLIIIGSIAVLFAVIQTTIVGWSEHTFMQYLMAGYFIFFGSLKIIGWRGFVASYRQYDDIAKRSRVYVTLYPLIEVGIGMTYYVGVQWLPFDIFVTLLMSQKAFSTWRTVRKGAVVQCACLGSFFSIPVTRVTVFEDLLMAAMALYMIRHTLGF